MAWTRQESHRYSSKNKAIKYLIYFHIIKKLSNYFRQCYKEKRKAKDPRASKPVCLLLTLLLDSYGQHLVC